MWQALIRFFFPKKSFTSSPQHPEPEGEKLRQTKSREAQSIDLDIEENFTGLVLNTRTFLDTQLNQIERMTLQQLDNLLSADVFDEKMVPRLPAVVPQLLSSLRSEDASGKHLAEQISRDPVLVGEVIRIANSAFYQTGSKINSLERAVVILGRIGLQRLIANVVMKPIFDIHHGHFGQHAGNYLWSQSERCAVACAYLARGRYDPFDAYLAGMACKIGMIVAIRILDHLCRNREPPKAILFYQVLLQKTKRLSVCIARNWQFPETVIDALEEQIKMNDQSKSPTLGDLLYMADRISQLHVLVEEKRLKDDINYLNRQLGGKLSDSELRCYAELTRIAKSSPR
jgi:HD-like signal output (HDOD) protein